MDNLVSKFQHYFFEKGEFDNIKVRSFDETLSFINSVSLDNERGHSPIGLDGPSVTIEHENGTFLKLCIDYNNKFVLYYLNVRDQVFCRSAEDINALTETIYTFFEEGKMDASFKKHRIWSSGNKKHFVTNSFEYKFGIKRFSGLMTEPLIFGIVFGWFSLFDKNGQHIMLVISLVFYLLMYGINWLLLLNYYHFSKHAYIKISKGIDEFYFGKTQETIQKYNKKELERITIYCNNKWRKCPWTAFRKFEINLKDGDCIQFTNLIISYDDFILKFPDYKMEYKHQFIPGIKKVGANKF